MEMTLTQKEKTLRKYGKCISLYSSRKMPGEYVVTCPGCRKEISTARDNLDDVEISVTKRGTATFWHKECGLSKVWNGRII